jgi:geranylgeranyl pyrophosphate synthase
VTIDASRRRAGAVLSWLARLVDGLPVPAGHRALLRVHLDVGRAQIDGGADLASAQLPLLVHAALAGSEEPALPLAGACTLLYLGADLLDNVADDEVPAAWHGWGAAEMQLAASTYLAPLYQLALAELGRGGVSDQRLWGLASLFRDALLEMSAGQLDDFRLGADEAVTPEASRLMVERKSGAEFALFARAGAALATDDADVAAHFAEVGRCLGAASQLGSDVADLWGAGASRDLTNGKRTLPVAHALTRCAGAERARLVALLARCRDEPSLHEEARGRLLDAGSVRYTALVMEVYRQRARRHLERALAGARGAGTAAAELRAMVAELVLLPERAAVAGTGPPSPPQEEPCVTTC